VQSPTATRLRAHGIRALSARRGATTSQCNRAGHAGAPGPTCRRAHGFLAGSLLTSLTPRALLHLISAPRFRYRHSLFAYLPLQNPTICTATLHIKQAERSWPGRAKKRKKKINFPYLLQEKICYSYALLLAVGLTSDRRYSEKSYDEKL
jgi:hypothetical protein